MDAKRIFLIVSGVGLAFVLAHVLAWTAPLLAEFTREIRVRVGDATNAAPDSPGRAGLIYVESPEVYTRQRLVNDRYLQDAWLRSKLDEIDNDDAVWIDEVQNQMRRAIVDIAAAAPGTSAPDAAAETPPVTLSEADRAQLSALPFETRFQLQSEARDKIRQLVLENALDDRHDLSGNTVFGLKFDTSVLPGSATRLNPTVVVRMKESPLDSLLSDTGDVPEAFVRHFMNYSDATENAGQSGSPLGSFPDTQKAILQDVDRHYYDWLQNVERRILEEVPARKTLCEEQALDIDLVTQMCAPDRKVTAREIASRTDPRSIVDRLAQWADQLDLATPALQADARSIVSMLAQQVGQADAAISSGEGTPAAILDALRQTASQLDMPAPTLHADARSVVDMLAERAEELDKAIGYVTRAVGVTPRIAHERVEELLLAAEVECSNPWADPAGELQLGTFRDFLADDSQFLTNSYTDGPWGQFFFVQTGLRLFDTPPGKNENACDANLEITLVEPQLEFFITSDTVNQAIFRNRLFPLDCSAEVCGSDIIWVKWPENLGTGARQHIVGRLNDAFLASVLSIARAEGFRQAICVDAPGTSVFGEGVSVEPANDTDTAADNCAYGFNFAIRWGAFEFFRKMADVESYTYTAFPRGDVSGVVTESGSSAQVGARGAAGLFSGGAAFSRSQAQRSVEATPEVINFASGESRSRADDGTLREPFDFAWTVVKPGVKDPMMVSQLVLVSVPAYLDEIELEIWKGFLDVDKVPVHRDAPMEALGGKSFNDAKLDARLGYLMQGLERREITIRVPPDYAALDSIVIGRSAILGPAINENKMNKDCRPFIVKRTGEDGDVYHFDLLIPGERLWRSSVVTLGGMKATAIEVMPNMRGLRASFQTPEEPKGTYDVRVWTSEGASEPVSFDFKPCDTNMPDAEDGTSTPDAEDGANTPDTENGTNRPDTDE